MGERPPYSIIPDMLSCVEQIREAIGPAEAAGILRAPEIRPINRIRAISGSLAVQGNRLSERQISAILDGNPVVTSLKEIHQAQNAISAYDQYPRWDPAGETDLLNANETLTPQESLQVTPQIRRLLSVLGQEVSRQDILYSLKLTDRKFCVSDVYCPRCSTAT